MMFMRVCEPRGPPNALLQLCKGGHQDSRVTCSTTATLTSSVFEASRMQAATTTFARKWHRLAKHAVEWEQGACTQPSPHMVRRRRLLAQQGMLKAPEVV